MLSSLNIILRKCLFFSVCYSLPLLYFMLDYFSMCLNVVGWLLKNT